MIFAIRELNKDTSGFMFITALIIPIILFVSWLSTIIIWLTSKKKNIKILSVIISIIITLSCIGWIYYSIESYRYQMEYELKVLTNETGEYTLYVPYLVNSKLRLELKVQSGEGNIGFVDINKTPILSSSNSLQVISNGNITISGKIIEQASPKMSLLFRNNERYDDYWVWCNRTNINQSIRLNISANFSFWSGDTGWHSESLNNSGYHSILDGWNIIIIYEETWYA